MVSLIKVTGSGTLSKKIVGIPEPVKAEQLVRSEYCWMQEGSVISKWKDKRDVFTIMNVHQVEMVELMNQRGKVLKKSNVVAN